jgi:hypothetical protein
LRNFHFSPGAEVPPTINRVSAIAEESLGRAAGRPTPGLDQPDLVASLSLPVASHRLDRPPSRDMAEAVARSNASVLGFLLEEIDLEALPRPGDERLAAALAPLRIKLDLLIDLMARLSYRDVILPPVSPVALGLTRVVWHSAQPWRPGDWLRLDLYFDQVFREPVSLYAAVTDCGSQDPDQNRRIEAKLSAMLDSTREQLTRLALLTQRRQQNRQRSGPNSASKP